MESLVCVVVLSLLVSSSLGFNAVYSQDSGRKFGGYRIVPKSCKDLTSNGKNKGICMFNYECTQRNGQVVGSCMDGFLFGACCKLPPGIVYQGIEFPSTTPSTTSLKPTSPQSDPVKPLTFHPIGETILLHKNGSVVKDQNNPQEFDLIKHSQYSTASPELSTFSYVSGPGGSVSSVTKPDKTDQWTTKSSQKSTTWSVPTIDSSENVNDKEVVTPFLLVSTREEPGLHSSTNKYNTFSKPITVTTDKNYFTTVNKNTDKYNFNHISSSTPHKGFPSQAEYAVTKPAYYTSVKISLKPRPTQMPTSKKPSHNNEDDNNMILIPTLNVDDYNKHDSVDATNNASINHILSLLNETVPSPEPTWLSINRPEKTNSPVYTTSTHYYHYDHTKAPASPSTTLYQVYGPSFQVTPQASVTPKPHINTTPEQAPTVIVLGPLNPVAQTKPSRKPINPYPISSVKPANTVTVIAPQEVSTVLHDSTISVGTTATQSTYWTTIRPNFYSKPQVTVSHPSTSGVYYATNSHPTTSKPSQIHIQTTNKPSSEFYSNKPWPTVQSKPAIYSSSAAASSLTERPTVYLTAKPISSNNLSTKPGTYTQGIYVTAKPQKPTINKLPISYSTVRPTTIKVPSTNQIHNSTEYLIAFPPVRDPNVTLIISQQEKPDQLTSEIYNEEDTHSTPQFVVDENLDNKVHGFVEKIVQSLGGNFVDLENVLLDGQTKLNSTGAQPSSKPTKKPPKRPVSSGSTKPTDSKPVSYKPNINTSTNRPSPTVLIVSTYRPKPEVVTITSTNRPTKWPTPTPSLVLFQPTSSSTKRPKTTKKPTVTTVVIENINISEEQTAATSPTTSSTTTKLTEVNFKKDCGVRPLMKNGRIVGGKGATFGEWPWQVLVREATWLGLFTKNKCGGVLITNRYVITAAHCQPGFLASLVAVFGEFDISGELESKRSISKNIRRVIVHRQYDAATFENDIALLELDTPVAFDSHIVPICMPKDDDDFTGRMATVTGWGRLKYGGGVPSVLQEVQVPVMENQVCQEMFQTAGHSKTIIGSFLCAGYANGQRDSCEGDSGGPLMVEREDGKWVLAGTVSHGIKCAAPYLPGVYMRTTYYKPWLQTITGVRNL